MEIGIAEDTEEKKKKRAAMKQLAAMLAEPFPPYDIEWRIERAGVKGNQPWAMVLAYVTNRAIMQRLDDVCGINNWRNEFHDIPNGVECGIYIRLDGEWICKWDASQNTHIEATKGGRSGAMKRAAVQWGIGRYLYNLDHAFAVISESGRNWQKAGYNQDKTLKHPAFNWDPPQLPEWALPNKKGE